MVSLEDLPGEIIAMAISHFSRQDMTVAVRVCQAWFSIVQPLLWHTVIIDCPKSFHRFKNGNEGKLAAIRNGHLIKHLETAYFSILEDLVIPRNDTIDSDGLNATAVVSIAACVCLESLSVDGQEVPAVPATRQSHRPQAQFGQWTPSTVFTGTIGTGSNSISPFASVVASGVSNFASIPQAFALTSAVVDGASMAAGAATAPILTTTSIPHISYHVPFPALVSNPAPPPPPPLDPASLMTMIHGSTSLKSLTLRGKVVDEDGVLSRVIHDLPSSVESLSILGNTLKPYAPPSHDNPELFNDASDIVDSGSLPLLREIRLGGDMINSQTIARLLRRCSALSVIRLSSKTKVSSGTIVTLLRNCCPDLRELHLGGVDLVSEDSDVAAYLSLSKKGWKTVGAPNVKFGPLSTAALLEHAATLENLWIEGCSGFTSATLQRLLCTAPNLKRLRALTPLRHHCEEEVKIHAQDLIQSRWVCLGLETFRCLIVGVPRPDIKHKMNGRPLTGPLHEYSLQDSHHVQRLVYEQLAVLTKLKELRLGCSIWDSSWRENFYEDHEYEGEYSDIGIRERAPGMYYQQPMRTRHLELGRQYECLSLTLESGLNLLRTLTDLEVIDFRRMQIGFWREPEQLWAREHWKKLRAPYRVFPFIDTNYRDPFWDVPEDEEEHDFPPLEWEKDIMNLYVAPSDSTLTP
jgi:hypothetical protein